MKNIQRNWKQGKYSSANVDGLENKWLMMSGTSWVRSILGFLGIKKVSGKHAFKFIKKRAEKFKRQKTSIIKRQLCY